MIEFGPFCECIKTGCYFTMETDDRIFNGDLFYDFVKREFQMRGISTDPQGNKRTILPPGEKGPVWIQLHMARELESAVRIDNGLYTDIRFVRAKVTSSLAAHIEEWYGDRSVMAAIEEHWEVVDNLAWRA